MNKFNEVSLSGKHVNELCKLLHFVVLMNKNVKRKSISGSYIFMKRKKILKDECNLDMECSILIYGYI